MKFRSKQAEQLYNLTQKERVRIEKQRGYYQEPEPLPEVAPPGIGPNGKLLPGWKYIKGGGVVKVPKKAGV